MDVALVADKGGVGKSTLAVHLAIRLAQLRHDVGLVDLDRNEASLTLLRERSEPPAVAAHSRDSIVAKRPEHDWLVWDTPAHPSQDLRRALADACDLMLVVAETDYESQTAAGRLCRVLVGQGIDARILVNQVYPTGREGADTVAAYRGAGIPCLEAVVRSYRCYERAAWDRRAVCDYPYPSADKAWADISAVTAELLTSLEVTHGTA